MLLCSLMRQVVRNNYGEFCGAGDELMHEGSEPAHFGADEPSPLN